MSELFSAAEIEIIRRAQNEDDILPSDLVGRIGAAIVEKLAELRHRPPGSDPTPKLIVGGNGLATQIAHAVARLQSGLPWPSDWAWVDYDEHGRFSLPSHELFGRGPVVLVGGVVVSDQHQDKMCDDITAIRAQELSIKDAIVVAAGEWPPYGQPPLMHASGVRLNRLVATPIVMDEQTGAQTG